VGHRVAVVGCTGIAGQQLVASLQRHPWFELTGLAASERSAGKTYGEALRDPGTGALRWWLPEDPAPELLEQVVQDAADLDPQAFSCIFTAVESDVARELEPRYARTTPVISTASAFRMAPDVPILVPGVNMEHASLLRVQQARRGWRGFITPIPNCTVTGLVMTLKPVAEAFGLRRVVVTSLQGVSGAGRSPGVIALDIIDNVVPFIPREEEKVEAESKKILGRLDGDTVREAALRLSATCTRVPVLEGHTEAVFVETERGATPEAAARVFREFGRDFVGLGLPSAPGRLLVVVGDPFRPQPRLDRDNEGGMATTVGRIRTDGVFEGGLKYVLVTHNTKMGAGKGAVLVAEYLASRGFIG